MTSLIRGRGVAKNDFNNKIYLIVNKRNVKGGGVKHLKKNEDVFYEWPFMIMKSKNEKKIFPFNINVKKEYTPLIFE